MSHNRSFRGMILRFFPRSHNSGTRLDESQVGVSKERSRGFVRRITNIFTSPSRKTKVGPRNGADAAAAASPRPANPRPKESATNIPSDELPLKEHADQSSSQYGATSLPSEQHSPSRPSNPAGADMSTNNTTIPPLQATRAPSPPPPPPSPPTPTIPPVSTVPPGTTGQLPTSPALSRSEEGSRQLLAECPNGEDPSLPGTECGLANGSSLPRREGQPPLPPKEPSDNTSSTSDNNSIQSDGVRLPPEERPISLMASEFTEEPGTNSTLPGGTVPSRAALVPQVPPTANVRYHDVGLARESTIARDFAITLSQEQNLGNEIASNQNGYTTSSHTRLPHSAPKVKGDFASDQKTEERAVHDTTLSVNPTKAALFSQVSNYKLNVRAWDDHRYTEQALERHECPTTPFEMVRWDQQAVIGSGAAGRVLLMRQEGTGELWAVKSIARDTLEAPDFNEELLTMTKLGDYDHLFVKFFGWYEDKAHVFIAMEYLKLGDLGTYMVDEQQSAKENAQEITKQILEGLEALHREGICHRDLKPQNILIASKDPIWAKIADFGISKRTKDTLLRTRCGTDGYFAPEILGAFTPAGTASTEITFTDSLDIWSLGSLVHQIFTSRTPFQGTDSDIELGTESLSGVIVSTQTTKSTTTTDMKSLVAYCDGRIEFPIELLQQCDLSEHGILFIKSMLSPDPGDRPTASALLEHPWLKERRAQRSHWYEELRHELSSLGETLVVELSGDNLLRQARTIDILPYLPCLRKERIPDILSVAIMKGYNIALLKLLQSPSRGAFDSATLGSLFQVATEAHNLDAVGVLLQLKADVGARVGDLTVLQWAAKSGHTDTAALFLKFSSNVSTSECQMALDLAIDPRHFDVINTLLAHGVYINGRNDKGYTPLQRAAENGDIDLIKLLLDAGAEVNRKTATQDHPTPLHAAAGNGHLETVKFLIDAGAELDAEAANTTGATALQTAAERGHIEVVKLLLDHGARVDIAATRTGRTVLQAAAQGGNIEIVKLLLVIGVDLYPKDHKTLQAAARSGNIEIVKLLFNAGASVNTLSALQEAVWRGYSDIVTFLLDTGVDVNGMGDRHNHVITPNFTIEGMESAHRHLSRPTLEVAAGSGRIDMLCLLLDAGADVKADGMAVLQAAVVSGSTDMVKSLLQAGAEVSSVSTEYKGASALRMAVKSGNMDIVKLLLDAGADVNSMPPVGRRVGHIALSHQLTILQEAAAAGHMDIFKILLDHGADIGRTAHPTCKTVLQAAVEGGNPDIINFLIDTGVNPGVNLGGPWGQRLLELAAWKGDMTTVKLLVDSGVNINARATDADRTALEAASARGHIELVRFLLRVGADVNVRVSSYGGPMAALQGAAAGDYLDIVKLLVNAGAYLDTKAGDSTGTLTALQAAAREGHIEVVRFLVSIRANVNMRGPIMNGRTALQASAERGHQEIVKCLWRAGADVNATPSNSGGRTALQAAVESGHLHIVKFLLNMGANVNAASCDILGVLALNAAAENGHLDIVKVLVDAGALIETPEKTALLAAAAGGNIQVVKYLLDRGANVNAQPGVGAYLTALGETAKRGNIPLARLLLNAGANVNASRGPDFKTTEGVLQTAASGWGHRDMVRFLLDAGAEVDATVTNHTNPRTALQAAVKWPGNLEIVKMLLAAGANANDKANPPPSMNYTGRLKRPLPRPPSMSEEDGSFPFPLDHNEKAIAKSVGTGFTSLQIAARTGDIDIVQCLLEAGADPNAKPSRFGATALQQASLHGHLDILKSLLDAGAELRGDSAGYSGRTALQAAAQEGHINIVRFLLDQGADVNAAAAQAGGRTALQAASEGGHVDIVRILLNAGADVNSEAIVEHGFTALQAASYEGHVDIVRVLLNAGALVDADAAAGGYTALDAANQSGNPVIFNLLLDAWNKQNG
ncbi:ankyrin repeat-containing domain protein [Morchella snyderi]|nr:ankyrin repeat-containing domain protein [Morchella snyderi]